jgi:hypothetical protein
MNPKNLKFYNIIFYSLVAAGILFIFFTNPFLIERYDPWRYHLTSIGEFYNGVGGAGRIWHLVWAKFFKALGISNIFTWAKIIHVCQFLLAATVLYFFSKTVLTILVNKDSITHNDTKNDGSNPPLPPFNNVGDRELLDAKDRIRIKFLSLFAVFLWFIGNGTFSIAYQQAWIMWYSVTYQGLTIPLFWYCTALTLKIFYEELSFKNTLLIVVQIAIVSFITAKFHPHELLYYIIQMPIIFAVNIKRVFSLKNKIAFFITIPIIFTIMFIAIKYFLYKQPTQVYSFILSNEPIGQLLQQTNVLGHSIVDHWNRFPNSFSEIALISLIAMIIFRVNYLFTKDKDISFNRNAFDALLVLSLLFFLIPMVPSVAGVAAYLTDYEQVYRFFFASPWFIFIPFAIYKVLTMKEIHIPLYKIVITVTLILFSIVYFHKHLFPYHTILNAKSIINSLDKTKVGMQ